jgi:guanylate kinase
MTVHGYGFDGQSFEAVERRGLMFVLSSPSGAGKTTLSRLLIERMPGLRMSVSVTTRAKRPGEIDGKDYLFVDKARFEEMAKRNELLEWATVFDNRYGTPRAPVEAALSAGQDVLFDIDWQGTQQLREKARADVVSVFILPPSAADLEKRLHSRAQDSNEVIRGRMSRASHEMSHWAEYAYWQNLLVGRTYLASRINSSSIVSKLSSSSRVVRMVGRGLGAYSDSTATFGWGS